MKNMAARVGMLAFCLFVLGPGLARGQERCQLVEEWYGTELDSTDNKVVTETVRKLREGGCQDVVRRRLKNPDAKIRYRTAWAVAELQASEFGPEMGALLSDPDVDVRIEAAYYIGKLKLPGYESQMRQLLNDPDVRVRERAQRYFDTSEAPRSGTQSAAQQVGRSIAELTGAPPSECDEFCTTLRKIIAARENGFFNLKGQETELYWKAKLELPGAEECWIASLRNTSYTCAHGYDLPADDAQKRFTDLVNRVTRSVPSSWKAGRKDPRKGLRFVADPETTEARYPAVNVHLNSKGDVFVQVWASGTR